MAALGQGTWHFAESPDRWAEEVTSIRLGVDLRMTVMDTAEMYGGGAVETLVGEAIAGRRSDVFLVDKVLPHHATRAGTVRACEESLARLGVDYIDLYLLHWPGRIPLVETIEGFADLTLGGKIRHWGVSNFDVDDLIELSGVSGGDAAQTNQILYNLTRRGPEYMLLPWLAQHRIPTMAYSPIEQGRLLKYPTLQSIARRHSIFSIGRSHRLAARSRSTFCDGSAAATAPRCGHLTIRCACRIRDAGRYGWCTDLLMSPTTRNCARPPASVAPLCRR
jgi:diketogulonate reductase-like aldo/keto reductase